MGKGISGFENIDPAKNTGTMGDYYYQKQVEARKAASWAEQEKAAKAKAAADKKAADKAAADKKAADKVAADKAAKAKAAKANVAKATPQPASTYVPPSAMQSLVSGLGSRTVSAEEFIRLTTPVPAGTGDSANAQNGGGSNAGGSSGGSSGASPVKTATPDIITIDQETLPAELMTSLIFENIGGQELISISRHDLISGSNMDFQSIKNLNEIYLNHNSLNIIPMPDSATVYEKNFPISWASHIVEDFSSADSTHISIDSVAKELQILVTNMKPGEQIEVEVLSSISEYNDTYGSYPESF
jgi:hypothetical protein